MAHRFFKERQSEKLPEVARPEASEKLPEVMRPKFGKNRALILDKLCMILNILVIAVLTKSAGSIFDMHRLVQIPSRKK